MTGRYVRLRGLERATPYGYSLYSFKVYGGEPAPASTTRTNLALNHPAYSNYYQHNGNSPAYVTDGGWPANLKDDASRWSSDWNADRWVSVDLGATSTISTVDLYWESAYAVDYLLQVSDDNSTWRTVYEPSAADIAARRANVQAPADATGRHDTVTLPQAATGRYVRMLGKERRSFYNPAPYTAQFGYSLYEFQVWGTGGSAAAAYPALPGDQSGTYQTTFFDDFTSAALDRSKWRVVRTGTEMGSVNGESQAYVDSTNNVRTQNGELILAAKYCKGCTQAGGGTYDFTSGRIDTHTHYDFTYGRVSARMKLPVGDGFWPAFWLLGSNVDDPSVSWPASGETDIMENIGYPTWTSTALPRPRLLRRRQHRRPPDLPQRRHRRPVAHLRRRMDPDRDALLRRRQPRPGDHPQQTRIHPRRLGLRPQPVRHPQPRPRRRVPRRLEPGDDSVLGAAPVERGQGGGGEYRLRWIGFGWSRSGEPGYVKALGVRATGRREHAAVRWAPGPRGYP